MKISLTVFFITSTLFGATFTHNFDDVPKSLSKCHEKAAALKKIFLSQTGNDTGQVACMKDSEKYSSFELSYSAQERLPYESTRVWGVFQGGLFKSQKVCNESLSDSVRQFEYNTGLPSFMAYCKADVASSSARWSPYILAFGVAKLRYQVSGFYYSSTPYKLDGKIFVESIKSALEKEGADYAGATTVPSLGYGSVEIHYYSKEKITFELVEFSRSEKIETCLNDLNRLNTTLSVTGNSAVITYCGQVSVGGYMEVTALFAGESPLRKRPSVESYKTYELCEADRSRLTEFYKANVDKGILDGFCGNINRTYKVFFIRGN